MNGTPIIEEMQGMSGMGALEQFRPGELTIDELSSLLDLENASGTTVGSGSDGSATGGLLSGMAGPPGALPPEMGGGLGSGGLASSGGGMSSMPGGGNGMGADALTGAQAAVGSPYEKVDPYAQLPSPNERSSIPADDAQVMSVLKQVLADRAKERRRASEYFQAQAATFNKKAFGQAY